MNTERGSMWYSYGFCALEFEHENVMNDGAEFYVVCNA